jgi:hypothetical protein
MTIQIPDGSVFGGLLYHSIKPTLNKTDIQSFQPFENQAQPVVKN